MNYKIIELEDISSAAKRISAKVVVDLNRESEEGVNQLVLHLIEKLKHEKVEKAKTLSRHGTKPFEVVYLYLYKDFDEKNHGIPLARASYINPTCKVKPFHFSDEFIDENTTIKFDGSYETMNQLIKENKVSDDVFKDRLTIQVQDLREAYESIEGFKYDFELLEKEFDKIEPKLRSMSEEKFIGFPNDEYMDLYQKHQGLLAALSNIGVVVKNKDYNNTKKQYLVSLYFEDAYKSEKYLVSRMN
ncbi:hypothetical protein D1B31_12630 [Neobacillus notoginsengisoli]|uniref:Uncharacterized protein n=1 Tax=Neobacillus notoginsengisoli TaxID=1578198 RepID=A0A417YTQ8_9BACI|nr:hypothetical protein [Neobacillus notoginsengisoli]RHW40386.1 hypothetical protein D1B31_12630 [Neobacillus notoginsengisoli]